MNCSIQSWGSNFHSSSSWVPRRCACGDHQSVGEPRIAKQTNIMDFPPQNHVLGGEEKNKFYVEMLIHHKPV